MILMRFSILITIYSYISFMICIYSIYYFRNRIAKVRSIFSLYRTALLGMWYFHLATIMSTLFHATNAHHLADNGITTGSQKL